jgi:hypothetical protein
MYSQYNDNIIKKKKMTNEVKENMHKKLNEFKKDTNKQL